MLSTEATQRPGHDGRGPEVHASPCHGPGARSCPGASKATPGRRIEPYVRDTGCPRAAGCYRPSRSSSGTHPATIGPPGGGAGMPLVLHKQSGPGSTTGGGGPRGSRGRSYGAPARGAARAGDGRDLRGPIRRGTLVGPLRRPQPYQRTFILAPDGEAALMCNGRVGWTDYSVGCPIPQSRVPIPPPIRGSSRPHPC